MSLSFGQWTLALSGTDVPPRELIGGKAWSIARMCAMELTVPPAFVVTSRACTAFMTEGRLPEGLEQELADGMAWLEDRTARRFGASPVLLVSVRSGSAVSMPGMMDTVLNLGMNDDTEAALAKECGDPAFARDTHRRFLELYTQIVLKGTVPHLDKDASPRDWRAAIAQAAGTEVPSDVTGQLRSAVQAVFESWNSRRAKRYRQHHGIPDTLGTAVTVQAMVFGNMDERSGTGVLFSRNPLTGDPAPYGEYLARAQGEDVVSGKFTPRPLEEMRASVPEAHTQLLAAAQRLEMECADVQDIEFTVQRGKLYLLQARSAKRAPQAAVRIAVDMVREGRIDVDTALHRVTPEQIRVLLCPRLEEGTAERAQLLAQGEGACPGVGIGVVVTDSDEAERRAAQGESVVLARTTTSPEDLHGMIAARAVITEHGGSTSHASVVSRALGRPCVVGCGEGSVSALAGRVVTVDGQSGRIFDGELPVAAPDANANETLCQLQEWAASRTRLRVLSSREAPEQGVAQLDQDPNAADPEKIGDIVKRLQGYSGAQGGAIGTEPGIRAALDAGLTCIVVDPALPALLLAAQLSRNL